MPSNPGIAQDNFDASFYILPPLNHEAYRPAHSESPWSASSHNSGDHLSLTLPSITPGDLAENPSLFHRLQSPSNLLSEAPTPSLSQHNSQRSSHLSRPRPIASHSPDPFSRSPIDLNSLFGSPPPHLLRASSIVDLTESSPGIMAPKKRGRESTPSESTSTKQKKRRTTPTPRKDPKPKEENATQSHSSEEIEQVDLVDVDDVKYADYRSSQQAALLKQQEEDEATKSSKLSNFTCIICLDNPTDLSVTACGHMFCSLCLHEALTAVPGRRICPVCRSNVGKTQRGKDPPKNGVFPLTMKLMTTNKKGKQPVRGK